MKSQSAFEKDIKNQPKNWQACLDHSFGKSGKAELKKAAKTIKKAGKIVISGIGASYNAGLALEFLFRNSGFDAVLEDSSELMNQFNLRKNDVLLLLSRSGKSVELVKLMELAREREIKIVSICNDPESPMAKGSDICLLMNVEFDHTISTATFSAILLVGILLNRISGGDIFDSKFKAEARTAIRSIEKWMKPLFDSPKIKNWLRPGNHYYFLARGSGRTASQNANLLWEEGTKSAATARTTGSFRHGSVEVVSENLNLMIWLEEGSPSFSHDLALFRDLKTLNVKVLAIGLDDASGIPLPDVPKPFQVLAQQVPAQIAAFHFSKMRGVDADSFLYCHYIVESEGGL